MTDLYDKSIPIIQLVTGLGVGGAERVVIELARRSQAKKQKIVVFSMTKKMTILNQYPDLDVDVVSLNIRRCNLFSYIDALYHLSSFIRVNGVRVLHAHMYHSFLLAMVLKVLFFPRISIVFTSHSFAGFKGLRRLMISVFRKFRAADVIFALGQHESMNARQVYVIPNGVELLPIPATISRTLFKAPFIFLALGRLETPKNPVALVKQFALMAARDTELWFVGGGYLEEKIRQTVAELNLCNKVKLLGVASDVPSVLNRVNCLVMPSLWEGMPIALLEAGAASLPVIVTPVGAIPSIIDDSNGYLSNVEDFHIYMDKVYCDYDAALQKGKALRDVVEREFSIDVMVDRHLEMYASISKIRR